MFSEQEQEEIINQFLDVIEMKKIINNKVSMCTKCKFTPQHMNLYHLPLSENTVKNICKFNYKECETCTTLRQLKSNVYGCSMKKYDNAVEAVEDKPCIEEYRGGEKEKRNTQMYFYVNLNPFPTYKKRQSKVLKNDTKFYNEKIHKEIKKCYYNLWRDKDDIKSFYTKLRSQIVAEYDKTFKKDVDTRQRFEKYIASHMNPVSDILKSICDYIANNEEQNQVEHKLYSKQTSSWVKARLSIIHFNDDYSWERYMDTRYPWLPKDEYLRRNGITTTKKIDDNYLNLDDFD